MQIMIRTLISSMAVMALAFTSIVATCQIPAAGALEFIPSQPTSADTIYLKSRAVARRSITWAPVTDANDDNESASARVKLPTHH